MLGPTELQGTPEKWPMLSSSAPSGVTKGRARSSTGCRSRPISSCASRAATMPAIRSSSTARPTSWRCCRPACCGPRSLPSSATAWCSIPQAFLDEVAKLKGQGVAISPDNLRVAENVTLILPLHRELDALRESSNAVTAIGTTRRGIGPAYEDKVGRRAIRLMDLADLDTLPHKIDRLLAHHNALRRGLEAGRDRRRRDPERAHRAGAETAALRRDGVAAARPQAPRGQAHPVRGRAGRASGRRPRHLSLRHLVQHGGGAGRDRHRHGPWRGRLCPGHLQGLYDPGRPGAVPDRIEQRDRRGRSAAAARNSASIPGASAAAAGSTPCWCGRLSAPAASPAWR